MELFAAFFQTSQKKKQTISSSFVLQQRISHLTTPILAQKFFGTLTIESEPQIIMKQEMKCGMNLSGRGLALPPKAFDSTEATEPELQL